MSPPGESDGQQPDDTRVAGASHSAHDGSISARLATLEASGSELHESCTDHVERLAAVYARSAWRCRPHEQTAVRAMEAALNKARDLLRSRGGKACAEAAVAVLEDALSTHAHALVASPDTVYGPPFSGVRHYTKACVVRLRWHALCTADTAPSSLPSSPTDCVTPRLRLFSSVLSGTISPMLGGRVALSPFPRNHQTDRVIVAGW